MEVFKIMRGNILSLYLFRIKVLGFDVSMLDLELSKKRITQEEYNHLVVYYNDNIAYS